MVAQKWLEMALACEQSAALLAKAENSRSSISRAYYSAYCAIHAMLLHRGEHPPKRGNWSHEKLPDSMFANFTTRSPKAKRRDAKRYLNSFSFLTTLRVTADYGPEVSLTSEDALRGRQLAGPFIRHAERILTS